MEQFENADETSPRVIQQFQHDYSFNLNGIVPPQPPKWRQVDHLYEDFKKFKRSCTCVFDGPMAHVLEKVKVNNATSLAVDQMVKTYMKDST